MDEHEIDPNPGAPAAPGLHPQGPTPPPPHPPGQGPPQWASPAIVGPTDPTFTGFPRRDPNAPRVPHPPVKRNTSPIPMIVVALLLLATAGGVALIVLHLSHSSKDESRAGAATTTTTVKTTTPPPTTEPPVTSAPPAVDTFGPQLTEYLKAHASGTTWEKMFTGAQWDNGTVKVFVTGVDFSASIDVCNAATAEVYRDPSHAGWSINVITFAGKGLPVLVTRSGATDTCQTNH